MSEMIFQLATHEVGHGFMAKLMGGRVHKYTFNLENGTGQSHWNLPSNDVKAKAFIVVSGYAAEVIEFGIETATKRGSKGLLSDSKFLNALGYNTQEAKAQILVEAMNLLKENWEQFKTERDQLASVLDVKLQNYDYYPILFLD